MAERFVSERNLQFLLYEVFNTDALVHDPYYADHNPENFRMAIQTAMKIGKNILKSKLREMDQQTPIFSDGQVKVNPAVRAFMRELGEGGWIGATFPFEVGGQQFPLIVWAACRFIFAACSYSGSVYEMLTTGAANLIVSFGSHFLKENYLPPILSGQWQGTMALTESQAGSSLSDITTQAEPKAEDYYKIQGQKTFISAGDHDGVDNIVHLLLAKIKGAPAGAKGISLFVVPKMRIENGTLVPNDVNTTGIYHKIGYRGTPSTQLSFGENDDCRGYLVGRPHQGLAQMFQMMNEQRLDVGLSAAGISSAAYYASLEYTGQRLQGRKAAHKDPTAPQIPIREHADIRRMLLFQRATLEGSLALLLQCKNYADRERLKSEKEKEKISLLLDLLTPVAKTYSSEMNFRSVSQGMQCMGGYGYCDEFPLEQYLRDARIHPIHEGTTGIHSITLLNRNVMLREGLAFSLFLDEVNDAIQEAKAFGELAYYAENLQDALGKLKEVTHYLTKVIRPKGIEIFLADATLYMKLFGIVSVAWQWLLQALAVMKARAQTPSGVEADFYEGKLYTFRFYFHYELPKVHPLVKRLMEADGITVEMKDTYFAD